MSRLHQNIDFKTKTKSCFESNNCWCLLSVNRFRIVQQIDERIVVLEYIGRYFRGHNTHACVEHQESHIPFFVLDLVRVFLLVLDPRQNPLPLAVRYSRHGVHDIDERDLDVDARTSARRFVYRNILGVVVDVHAELLPVDAPAYTGHVVGHRLVECRMHRRAYKRVYIWNPRAYVPKYSVYILDTLEVVAFLVVTSYLQRAVSRQFDVHAFFSNDEKDGDRVFERAAVTRRCCSLPHVLEFLEHDTSLHISRMRNRNLGVQAAYIDRHVGLDDNSARGLFERIKSWKYVHLVWLYYYIHAKNCLSFSGYFGIFRQNKDYEQDNSKHRCGDRQSHLCRRYNHKQRYGYKQDDEYV